MNTKEFVNALTIVKPGLSNKEVVEQSTSFAFLNDRVVTYNDQISISHPVAGLSITGAVKAELLYKFLKKVKAEEIEILETEKELIITAGRSTVSLAYETEVKFDLNQLQQKKKWIPLCSNFTSNLTFVAKAVSKDNDTPALTCIHVHKEGFVEATDRFRVIRVFDTLQKEVLLPINVISSLKEINPTKICIEKQWTHFQSEKGTVLSCRIFTAEYPNITPLLGLSKDAVLLKLPSTLKEILERASLFVTSNNGQSDPVDITIKDKKLTVSITTVAGRFSESAPMRYSGEPVIFSIRTYLLTGMLDDPKCKVYKDKNTLKFKADEWESIVMLYVKS